MRFYKPVVFFLLLLPGLCTWGQQPLLPAIPDFKSYTDTLSYNIAHDYINEHSENETEECLTIALHLYQKASENKLDKAKALMAKDAGVLYDYKGNLDSTLYYLHISRTIFQQQKNSLEESHVVNNIAVAYYLRGIYELSVRNHIVALNLRQAAGSQKHIAQSLNNLGLLYRAKKDYPSAVDNYNKSLAIKGALNDSAGQLNTLMNIGACYQSWEKYDSALLYAKKGEELARKLNKIDDIIGCRANKAAAYVNLNMNTESLQEAETVLKYQPTDTKTLLTIYQTLSFVYKNLNQLPLAASYSLKGLEVATKTNRKEQKMKYYKTLAGVYEKMGDEQQAYKYLRQHQLLSDSLYKEENSRQINEMAAVYENNKKEATINSLNTDIKTKEVAINERSKERNLFIIASLVLLVMSVLAYKAYSVIKKTKNALAEKNIIIERSLAEKEVLMKEIHHRVKNNLQVVSSLLNMQADYIQDPKAADAILESKNRVMSMALIHQNLYQHDNITGIDVKSYIEKLSRNLVASYNSTSKPIDVDIATQSLIIDVDTLIPLGLILNELITNAIKYAFTDNSNPRLDIELTESNNQLHLKVVDNGPGFSEKRLLQNNSFGYKIIQAFLPKLKGKLDIASNNGAIVTVSIENYKINNG